MIRMRIREEEGFGILSTADLSATLQLADSRTILGSADTPLSSYVFATSRCVPVIQNLLDYATR